MLCGTVCPKLPSAALSLTEFTRLLCWVFSVCECETSDKSDVLFGEMIRLKTTKLPLKVYDTRNTSMYHTLSLWFCTECMLSLNMGLAGLSEITLMSEIRCLYPISNFIPVMWKMFPIDDVIMQSLLCWTVTMIHDDSILFSTTIPSVL